MEYERRDLRKKVIKTREEKIAKLLLTVEKDTVERGCLFQALFGKSFTERVLWLEEQSQPMLDLMIKKCETCGGCKFLK